MPVDADKWVGGDQIPSIWVKGDGRGPWDVAQC